MNEPRDPQDPGDKPPKPPIVLGPDDLPEEVTAAIEQVMDEMNMLELTDHMFLFEQLRAAGHDVKRLGRLYPNLPQWVLNGLIKRTLTMDGHGYLRDLH